MRPRPADAGLAAGGPKNLLGTDLSGTPQGTDLKRASTPLFSNHYFWVTSGGAVDPAACSGTGRKALTSAPFDRTHRRNRTYRTGFPSRSFLGQLSRSRKVLVNVPIDVPGRGHEQTRP